MHSNYLLMAIPVWHIFHQSEAALSLELVCLPICTSSFFVSFIVLGTYHLNLCEVQLSEAY